MHLSNYPSTIVHRIIIPNPLSPTLYSSEVSKPGSVLQFLHALRALLRKYSTQITAMTTLPLTLDPSIAPSTEEIQYSKGSVYELK
jgi:elongator complex protein 4